MKVLTAIPVYNEERHLAHVLDEVRPYASNILVVNDGSTDGTGELLSLLESATGLDVVTHPRNQGYGAALCSAFEFFKSSDCDVLVTMDCDGQHEPNRIPVLLEALDSATDIVSGSRYLREFRRLSLPTPKDRQQINQIITTELNEAFGLGITDSFCGFKAYRKGAVSRLRITERGWGMPLQLWVQAARLSLKIREVGVPRLYLDPNRAFGGMLNDANERLAYYRRVIADAVAEETAACRRNTCHA